MGTDSFGDLERWAAEARAGEAVDERVRERWLRTQAAESSTVRGVLVALAEAGTPLVITMLTDRRHSGRLAMVGKDFVLVRRQDNRSTLLALAALATVSPTGATRPVHADDEHDARRRSVTLADVLARAVGERPRLALWAGTACLAGDLMEVGSDMATLRTDADRPRLTYVSVASVSEVSLLGSG